MAAVPGRFAGWRGGGVDPTKPSIARVYDYWLGGAHNLVADRGLGRRMETLDPRIPAACKANRAFLGRAVQYLAAEAGIRQFIDIGSGIPTAGNGPEGAPHAGAGARGGDPAGGKSRACRYPGCPPRSRRSPVPSGHWQAG